MSFFETMKEKARQNIKTILLPESEDVRVIQAAADVEEEGFAKAVLIGNEENVKQIALDNNIDVSKVTIINLCKSFPKPNQLINPIILTKKITQ